MRQTQAWLAADRFQQSLPRLAYRISWPRNTFDVEPCDPFVAHIDHRRKVVQRRGDQLADAQDGLFVWQDEGCLGAQVLGLAQRHSRQNTEWL